MNATIFPSDLGHFALVWDEVALHRIILPYASQRKLQAAICTKERACDGRHATPHWVQQLAQDISAYYAGQLAIEQIKRPQLAFGKLTEFQSMVYAELSRTSSSEILSYQELARRVGRPKAARAVGSCMARNPFPLLIPCHRVVTASGKLGHFTADSGIVMKRQMQQLDVAISTH